VGPERPGEESVISEESTLDLRATREARGLTLKEISSSTRINVSNLKAIEDQRFELLPEPIYARAFIDMYAKTLAIDGKKILSLYDTYLDSLEPDQDRYEVLKTLAEEKRHLEVWIWVIIALGLITLIGSYSLYQWRTRVLQGAEGLSPARTTEVTGELQSVPEDISLPERGDVPTTGEDMSQDRDRAPSTDLSVADEIQDQTITDTPVAEVEQPAAGEDQPDTQIEEPVETLGPDKVLTNQEKPYILVVEASERTWIEIGRDGEPPFEVMLRPGERFTESAMGGFNLIIGNAGGVDIRFQGKLLGPMGEHGEVIHLTLPPER